MTDEKLDRIILLLEALCKKFEARVPGPVAPMTEAEKKLYQLDRQRQHVEGLTTKEEFFSRKDTGGV